jgi:hypothetical protein
MLALPASASAASSQFSTTFRGTQEPLKVRGVSGTYAEQKLSLPPFSVTCAAAHMTGGPSPGYTELKNDVKLSRCTTSVPVESQSITAPAKVNAPLNLFFKGDGDAELVNPVEVSIPGLKCTIQIAEGAALRNEFMNGGEEPQLPYGDFSVPVRNLRDFPSGFQNRMQIDADEVGLSYSFEGGCANLTPQEGAYSGLLDLEAVHGNLEFIPGAEWNRVVNNGG